MQKTVDIKAIPFDGGVITAVDKQLLKSGQFSTLQNFRWRRPSFERRKGQLIQHNTTSNANPVATMYQFRANRFGTDELHFYGQWNDGQVQEATNMPPTTTTGNFGTAVLSAVTGSKSCSWSTINDRCLYSDSVRQHQIYTGSSSLPLAFVVYKGTVAIPRIPTEGDDYGIEVTDNLSSTVAVIDALNTLASYHAVYVMCPVKAKSLTLTVTSANGNASTMSFAYWNGAFNSVGVTDGTASAGKTIGQSGIISWTPQSDELPSYMFGATGFWYRISVSAQLSATVRVSEVRYNSNWQSLVNIWDGVLRDAIECQVYDASTTNYKIYGTASIDIANMTASDYFYFSSIDQIEGFHADVGATPNIIYATVTGTDISFIDGGAGDDSIKKVIDKDFAAMGFEVGQAIAITGSTSNNINTVITRVSSNILSVPTGVLVTEALGANVTITHTKGTVAVNEVATWTGAGWTSVGGTLSDGTIGMSKSGFVSWNRTAVAPSKTQFNQSGYYAYWYRVKFSFSYTGDTISRAANIGIQTMPYFDIDDLGLGICNGAWKGRAAISSDRYPSYVYFPAINEPSFLNGNDFGLIEVGDGRSNKVLAMKTFHNELLVWQAEKGKEGGCLTLIEGYSPKTFGKLVISNNKGIVNSKSAVIVEGVRTDASGEDRSRTIAFWLSRYGVMATDGTAIFSVSEPIKNYFDTTKSECIRAGYEDKHWLEYDSTYNILRIGLVSGSSATNPNVFPVFDLEGKNWAFDTSADNALSCMTEIQAGSGNIPVIQMVGSVNGFIHTSNTGNTDNGQTVTPQATMEIDGGGKRIRIRQELLRCKSQSIGDITRTVDINCVGTFNNSNISLPMQAINSGESYRRHRLKEALTGDHISLRWQAISDVTLNDLGLEIFEIENKI